MGVLVEYVDGGGLRPSGRYVGVTASAVMSTGAKRSCGTSLLDADALLLSKGLGESYERFSRDNQRQRNP